MKMQLNPSWKLYTVVKGASQMSGRRCRKVYGREAKKNQDDIFAVARQLEMRSDSIARKLGKKLQVTMAP